jgi:hypothetical protein
VTAVNGPLREPPNCGLQVGAEHHPAGQLRDSNASGWGASGAGADHRETLTVLALGGRHEREGPVAEGDGDVEPFSHPDQKSIGGHRHDGEAVTVGDGHAMPTERDPERGVGACVDEPDPDPLSGPAGQRDRRVRGPAVDHVVRVGDVPGTAEKPGLHLLAHAPHGAVVHP